MAPNPATSAIHADDRVNIVSDVAPPIHTATTFRYPSDPEKLKPRPGLDAVEVFDQSRPLVYSRLASSNINRLETILTPLIFPDAKEEELKVLSNHVVSYSSGLSAFHGMLVHLVPKVIAMRGYHGCHVVVGLHQRMHGLKEVDVFASDSEWDKAGLGKGDLVHLETPLNPTGEAYNIQEFADRAHKRGALLSVDATFAPPGLQDPFAFGADIVMHSGTKYIGGHSDMLCGVLAIARGPDGLKRATDLRTDRISLGSVLGSLESWLGVRSLRTLQLRVQRQSQNATNLVTWLNDSLNGKGEDADAVQKVVKTVKHASLQTADFSWLKTQMPNGFGPVFAIFTHNADLARNLPSKLRFFHHATSLGGVESLIEWRRMSDRGCDPTVLRVSVGIEEWTDLREDLARAFRELREGQAGKE